MHDVLIVTGCCATFFIDMVSALQKVHRRLSEAPCGTELGELPVSLSFARDMFVSKADRLVLKIYIKYLHVQGMIA